MAAAATAMLPMRAAAGHRPDDGWCGHIVCFLSPPTPPSRDTTIRFCSGGGVINDRRQHGNGGAATAVTAWQWHGSKVATVGSAAAGLRRWHGGAGGSGSADVVASLEAWRQCGIIGGGGNGGSSSLPAARLQRNGGRHGRGSRCHRRVSTAGRRSRIVRVRFPSPPPPCNATI